MPLQDDLVRFWNESRDYYIVNSDANASEEAAAAHRRIAALLRELNVATVLDVGCGTGHVAETIAELTPDVAYTGIDVADAAVARARELGRPGTYVVGDTAALPFDDASFDAVISFYALEHFTQPESSVREMARVAANVVVIYAMNYDRPLGTVSSMRFGLRDKARLHPANLAVYAANRARHGARQLAKHLRYRVDRHYRSFELIDRPLVLEGRYEPDFDAVHIVSGESILRTLEAEGFEIAVSNVPRRLFALRPVGLEVVARRPAA